MRMRVGDFRYYVYPPATGSHYNPSTGTRDTITSPAAVVLVELMLAKIDRRGVVKGFFVVPRNNREAFNVSSIEVDRKDLYATVDEANKVLFMKKLSGEFK